MTLTDIATCFSMGQFSPIQQHFSEAITWEIVGEQQLSGFDQVLKHCQSIEHYFTTVTHEFHIQAIHHTGHHPVPIVQAPKRAVPSTQTEFFPYFTSHLILRYIHPQGIVPMLCCPANQRGASHADSRSQKRNAQRFP